MVGKQPALLWVCSCITFAAGAPSIRDVIAFPKSTAGQCLLTGAPASVSASQLRDLHVAAAALQDSNGAAAGTAATNANDQNGASEAVISG